MLRILQWLWAFVLTVFFTSIHTIIGLFGMVAGWSGFRALFGFGTGAGGWWHALVGLAMIVFGLLILGWMPRTVRKLSGRDPVETPSNF